MKIQTDKGEKEITLKNLKGRHTKKGIKLLIKAQTGNEEADMSALDKYLDYLDEISAEMSGMSVEELDDLDNDEKNKIVGYYQNKIESRIDFLKSSLKQPDSVPVEKKE